MSNNIAVKITADIVDLQSKFGTARAELQATEAEFRKLARASAAGTLDTAGQARYAQLSQTLLEQRSVVQGLSGDLAQAGFASSTFGRAAVTAGVDAERAGVNVSSLTRFTRELFDEVSSGRTRYLPSTLAELANQGFHLKPAMLAGYGGVAVLAAGLGYLAYKSIEAQDAIQGIAASAAFLGNTNVSSDFAGQLVAQIKSAADVGEDEAEKTARTITSIQNLSNESMSAIAGNIGVVAHALGTTTDKAAATVAKMLDVNTSVDKLKELLPGLTAAQVQEAQASQQTGDYASILTERWKLLTSQLEVMQESQRKAIQQKLAFAQSAAGQQDVAGKAEIDNSYIYIHQLQEQQRQIEKNIALTKEMAAHPLGPQAAQNQLKGALDDADKLNEKATERRQILGQIHEMEIAILHANAQQKAELEAGIAAAREKLAGLSGGGEGNSELQAAEEAANIKHQMAEQEISEANHTLDQIAAAQEQARAQELAAEEQAANTKHQIAEREIADASRTLKTIADDRRKADHDRLQEEQRTARSIESFENQMLSGVISGRMTFAEMERRIFQQLAAAEIESALHAATEKLIITQTADGQRKTIEGATAIKSIGSDAAQAGAAAYRAMVGIPYVGPFIAPAAAAVAFATVGAYKSLVSFDQGSFNLPQDMVAQVHAGEMIIPKPFAQEIRDKGFGGGGSTEHHYHINANDAASFQDMLLRNPSALAAGMRKVIRNGALA